jgi:predicted nucleic acid-binding protein
MVMLDASVLLAAEDADDPHHHDARALLSSKDRLTTLDLAHYEVANVAVRSWRDEGAAERLRERISALTDDGGLVRVDEGMMAAAGALARQHGISVYDAAYVAAARQLDAVLVSCDVRDLVSRGLAVAPGQPSREGSDRPGEEGRT